ncbi:beta-ketoacyl synthase N-terminal-like domain-containing protein [Pseudoduganella sp. SL102]|uniref:beta-ketoacyl synthase N-terminal-like domain-containing protein n=1 Tax=Pseudoduganella sp. SL102 TaxID=2995154 RepID=UPI00248BC0BB|nr:beta-ketoacyl synthase N-terminal-like domain-containing protein [Pseudoduganella sp. SL102]WBS00589.1 beta-ketoacyl synthase N-terminal-like domain-containing protein [Pseudoduganella sp. SL102]
MNGEPIHIAAPGAATAVGRDAWASAAAVRAGISGFVEHPWMIDRAGEPMRAAPAPWLDPGLSGAARLAALLLPAVAQALSPVTDLPEGAEPVRTGLVLGLPAPRPGLDADVRAALVAAVRAGFGDRLAGIEVFPAGHAAGLLALGAAARLLHQGALDACVVAGVDSYLEAETLEWLEHCGQLHGAGTLNNAWGFVPGEGAGAVLAMRRPVAARLGCGSLGRILSVGAGMEACRIKTRTVCTGAGLTQAFRQALAPLAGGDGAITDVYCDMNGEPYRADEYAFTAVRTKEAFVSVSDFIAPADCWGDVGAAGAPLHLALAAIAGAKGYARGKLAFTWASAEGGERAAALMATGWR